MAECESIVEIGSETVIVQVQGDPVVVGTSDDPVILELVAATVRVELQTAPTVLVEVGVPGPSGPQGPQGPQGDPGVGIPIVDVREGVTPDGDVDGVNTTYVIPSGDKAYHLDPGPKIKVYVNGVRQSEGEGSDFTVSESGGVGTGYDTIEMNYLLIPANPGRVYGDVLRIDYVVVS